jgi:pimeloyl-ACP methyl ester carboxylesterase
MNPDRETVQAPSLALLLRELRAPLELVHFVLTGAFVSSLPRGDGHPVMLIPGFGAGDLAMRPLAMALERLGYAASTWGQGRNMGMNRKLHLALSQRLGQLQEHHGAKVSLIGWSLGGVFARELARAQPARVRQVITLGSPFNANPEANNMMPLFRLAQRGKPVKDDREGFERRRVAPPVPCTAIHSKTDGIVAWQCSLEEHGANTENLEVRSSHFGLVANREVLESIAKVLARSSG